MSWELPRRRSKYLNEAIVAVLQWPISCSVEWSRPALRTFSVQWLQPKPNGVSDPSEKALEKSPQS